MEINLKVFILLPFSFLSHKLNHCVELGTFLDRMERLKGSPDGIISFPKLDQFYNFSDF